VNNQQLIFGFNSLRAKKARLGVLLSKRFVRIGLVATIGLLLLGGIGLITLQASIGVVIAALAAWPLMIVAWYHYELHDVPPGNNPQTLDELLASDVLGRLPVNPSPQQIAKVVMSVNGGYFFVTRFGIGPSFVVDLSSSEAVESGVIWQSANRLREHYGSHTITAGMLLCALLEQIPASQQLLAQLQIESEDLVRGVGWQEHITDVIAVQRTKKHTGGIGRDWSFGYTPLLNRFALNISESVAQSGLLKRDIEGHEEIIQQLMNQLSSGGRRNAVLVGPTGVGKTTMLYAFAEQLFRPSAAIPKSMQFRQVMALDPASLIAQARGRGELEGLVQELFYEALRAKNIILFLDDAQLFLQEGTGSVDLSNLLLPILEGGGLRIVLAMDEQWWLRLSQTNPALTQYMNRISVVPLDYADTMLVLEDQLLLMEFRYRVTYMYQSLAEAYRLSERYVQDQAMPGKAIALLEAAAQLADNGFVTAASVQKAVEKAYGVKVRNAHTSDERQILLNMESLIHKRMINQVRAVGVVSNALRRARAGVRNQDKPIGTFMFLGPTGVGKTELAKSLAAVYFGGEDRLIRLDLNEFNQPDDVKRLIADGAQDPNSLTAQIAKQPFSVVLLDEIEKAHPAVLNTLLQLLDEGVLRDIRNRSISFRDAIIIATSNAGADRIRTFIQNGFQVEQFEQPFIDELIDSGQFKPEFLNRFDEIVVFRPLDETELLQVVDLILVGVNKTLAAQKITVHLSDEAKQLIVKTGYDPRLGARPMRRVVQRSVEDLVAKQMLSGQVAPGSVIEISLEDIQGVVGS
jgi:ATP-dependent Clp protease ATP-binding subunit ClpC